MSALWIFLTGALACGVLLGVLIGFLISGARVNKLIALSGRRSRYRKLSDADSVTETETDESGVEEIRDNGEELKMALCVRTDLQMGKGKMCAQSGHASLGLYQKCLKLKYPLLSRWTSQGQRKVALKIKDEAELQALYQQARSLRIPAFIVHDAGRTQIASGSATVLAIGPGGDSLMNEVTGHLKLL